MNVDAGDGCRPTGVNRHYDTAPDGTPACGSTDGVGYTVVWHHRTDDPDGEVAHHRGAFPEDLIDVLLDRLDYLAGTAYGAGDDDLLYAAECLDMALRSLRKRPVRRGARP